MSPVWMPYFAVGLALHHAQERRDVFVQTQNQKVRRCVTDRSSIKHARNPWKLTSMVRCIIPKNLSPFSVCTLKIELIKVKCEIAWGLSNHLNLTSHDYKITAFPDLCWPSADYSQMINCWNVSLTVWQWWVFSKDPVSPPLLQSGHVMRLSDLAQTCLI